MREKVWLDHQHLVAMEAHAVSCFPQEACGLLAVDAGAAVTMVYCLTNIDASAYRFTVDPAEHYGAWRHAAGRGWEIGGSFHSHPASAAAPSATDIAGALDPSWMYFITGPVEPGPPLTRAYRIRQGAATEIDVAIR